MDQTKNTQYSFESVNTRTITSDILSDLARIEQDLWAREDWLWHYVECSCCNKKFSKEDMYGHLEKNIVLQTCSDIEKILWIDTPSCHICWNETIFLYPPTQHAKVIEHRYANTVDSYLTLVRNNAWKIVGFVDGYIDNFDNIYLNELKNFHDKFSPNDLKASIERNTWVEVPNQIFIGSALWILKSDKSFKLMYTLLQHFFSSIRTNISQSIFWLSELVIWSPTHQLYSSIWAIPSFSGSNDKVLGTHTDIFVQEDMIRIFRENFSLDWKEYLKKNIRRK